MFSQEATLAYEQHMELYAAKQPQASEMDVLDLSFPSSENRGWWILHDDS